MASDQDPSFEPATFQFQVLSLPALQVGLLLGLVVLEVLLLLRQPLLLFFLGGRLVFVQLLIGRQQKANGDSGPPPAGQRVGTLFSDDLPL